MSKITVCSPLFSSQDILTEEASIASTINFKCTNGKCRYSHQTEPSHGLDELTEKSPFQVREPVLVYADLVGDPIIESSDDDLKACTLPNEPAQAASIKAKAIASSFDFEYGREKVKLTYCS